MCRFCRPVLRGSKVAAPDAERVKNTPPSHPTYSRWESCGVKTRAWTSAWTRAPIGMTDMLEASPPPDPVVVTVHRYSDAAHVSAPAAPLGRVDPPR